MASIRKRGDTYQVRYRDACGTERSVTCPDRKTAKAIKLDIEKARVLGEVWRPVEQKAPPTLGEVWRQPCHAFRKALISGLVGAGVQEHLVKALAGHARGTTWEAHTRKGAVR